MRFTLEIACDTVAFGENPEAAIASILRGVANTLDYVGTLPEHKQIVTPIADVNGSDVGKWKLDRRPAVTSARISKTVATLDSQDKGNF